MHEDIIVRLLDNWCITEHTDAKLLYLTDMCFQAWSVLLSGCVSSASSSFRDLMVVKYSVYRHSFLELNLFCSFSPFWLVFFFQI